MNTLAKLVTETIEQLEAQNQPQLAKLEIVDEWMSDAAKQGLATTNIHDNHGAPVLRTDDVLKWEPEHLGRK